MVYWHTLSLSKKNSIVKFLIFHFRIETHIFSDDSEGEVLRRLSEFNSLYRKLDKKYSKSGILVPPPPGLINKNILNNMKIIIDI